MKRKIDKHHIKFLLVSEWAVGYKNINVILNMMNNHIIIAISNDCTHVRTDKVHYTTNNGQIIHHGHGLCDLGFIKSTGPRFIEFTAKGW